MADMLRSDITKPPYPARRVAARPAHEQEAFNRFTSRRFAHYNVIVLMTGYPIHIPNRVQNDRYGASEPVS